jgi:hypothetical protein
MSSHPHKLFPKFQINVNFLYFCNDFEQNVYIYFTYTLNCRLMLNFHIFVTTVNQFFYIILRGYTFSLSDIYFAVLTSHEIPCYIIIPASHLIFLLKINNSNLFNSPLWTTKKRPLCNRTGIQGLAEQIYVIRNNSIYSELTTVLIPLFEATAREWIHFIRL